MFELLKGRGTTIITVVVIAVIIVVAFFTFGNQDSGEVSEEAAEQTQEEISEEDKAKEEEEAEKNKFPKVYTVKKGDHLWNISTRFYNDGFKWTVVAAENNLNNPDIIIPGQKLTLPKVDLTKTYTVVSGDTLWDISHNLYGTGFQWEKIKAANPGKIGILKNGNPLILPGQILKIP